jgi:hypothetical protein
MEKGKEAVGLGQNALLPPLACIQNRGEGGSGATWPAGRALAGGPCSAAAGRRGKTERAPRGFDSRAHLESGRRVEVDRRDEADCRLGGSGGGAVWCRGEGKGFRRCEVRWGMRRGSL